MLNKQSNLFIASVIGVFVVDRYAVNRWLPSIRFKKWRLTANLIKFFVWPYIIYKFAEYLSHYSVSTTPKRIDKKCSKSKKSIILGFQNILRAIKYSKGLYKSTDCKSCWRKGKLLTGKEFLSFFDYT